MEAARQLDEAIRRVDPELTEFLRPDPHTRARCASILGRAHVREAQRRRVTPSQKYLDLISAAAPWL